MGIVPSTFKQATCTRLLLWFASLLLLSQRLMLMLLSSTELMDMVDMVLDMPVTDMLDTHMPLDTLMVVTHMPMELTTERDPLMLSQKLMPLTCMELMDMVDMVLDMPDT